MEGVQPSAAERASAARKTSTVPSGRCNSRDIADYYGVKIACVSKACQRGDIPGAHKVLNRWLFDDFQAVIDGWKPPLVERVEAGLPAIGGREPTGPFAKGNTFAVGKKTGRPTRKVERRFMATLISQMKEEDWVGIIRKAIDQALKGDYKARSWLSQYLIGKPVERILAKVDVGGERFSVAERAVAVEQLLGFLTSRGEGDDIIDGEVVVAGPDTTPG